MALHQPEPPPIGRLAPCLAPYPSTLTAAVKPLVRHARRLRVIPDGVALLRRAVEAWRVAHDELEAALPPGTAQAPRDGLARIG